MGEPISAAAILVTAGLLVLVLRSGLMALLDRADGGWHRSTSDENRQLVVVGVVLAALAAVLWIVVGIRALLD